MNACFLPLHFVLDQRPKPVPFFQSNFRAGILTVHGKAGHRFFAVWIEFRFLNLEDVLRLVQPGDIGTGVGGLCDLFTGPLRG